VFLLFLLIALIPSIIGSLSGIGGGIIIKPVLDLLTANGFAENVFNLQLGIMEINFLSGCTALIMSLVSLFLRRNSGTKLEHGRGIPLAIGASTGGIIGKMLLSSFTKSMDKNFVGIIQTSILIVLIILVVLYTFKKESLARKDVRHILSCAALGLGMGCLSAFLGIGGGPINIMIISFFLSTDTKTSGHYSLLIIFLSQLASLFSSLISGIPEIVPLVLIAMLCGGVAGAFSGSFIVKHLRNQHVDRVFSIVMILIIVVCIYNLLNFIRA
jgi:uncharacterized membrane protein YfcA